MRKKKLFFLVLFDPFAPQEMSQTLFQGFNSNLVGLLPVLFALASANASAFEHGSIAESIQGRGYGIATPGFGLIASEHALAALIPTCALYERVVVISAKKIQELINDSKDLPENIIFDRTDRPWPEGALALINDNTATSATSDQQSTHAPITLAGHNIIVPNACILQAAGYPVELPRFMSGMEDAYVAEIVRSVQAVEQLRKSVGLPSLAATQPLGTKLIISVPGLFRAWALRKKLDTRGMEPDKAKALRHIAKFILNPDSYMTAAFDDLDLLLKNGELRDEVATSLMLRGPELKLFTASLALLASTSAAPTIRLPPRIAKFRSELRGIQTLDERGMMGRAEAVTLSSKVRSMGEKMREAIPRSLMDIIDNTKGHIKIVGDVPLELTLSGGGFPLMLSNPTSRIGATPGDLLLRLSMPKSVLTPDASGFEHLTVIRSYKHGDPIRPLAEQALNVFCPQWGEEDLVKFVDVTNGSEFAEALNCCDDEVVVYDGHGTTDEVTGHSYLELAAERVDTFALKAKLRRAPAVMFLLACSTQPLDSSHMSVANGILSWNRVTTVIGTLGPVSGPSAAIMFGRFVHWMSGTLRKFLKEGETGITTWVDAFSLHLRMCYVTDVILALINYSDIGLNHSHFIELQCKGSMRAVAAGNWLKQFLGDIAQVCNASEERVENEWRKYAYFSESLKYVQMGRPEAILLVPRNTK